METTLRRKIGVIWSELVLVGVGMHVWVPVVCEVDVSLRLKLAVGPVIPFSGLGLIAKLGP